MTPLGWKPNKPLLYNSTACLCTHLCVCSSVEKKNIYIYIFLLQIKSSYAFHSVWKADRGHVLCTVTIIRSEPCSSIYNILFQFIRSITRYHISLKLFTMAPPQHRNTLQHNSPLLKIDQCEVTHSGKHSARETNNAVKNKRKNTD